MNGEAPTPDDEQVRGLAGERTDLAWSRSGLAVMVCAAALLKQVLLSFDETGPRVVVLGLLVAGAVAWAATLLHARTVTRSSLAGERLADPALLRGIALATVALGTLATVLSLLPSP